MAGSRKSKEIEAQSRKPLPQGYAAGAGGGEHLVHFRNAGNIFINVDAAKGANNFALGARPSVGSGIPVNRSAHSCCTGFHDFSGNLHHGSACWRWGAGRPDQPTSTGGALKSLRHCPPMRGFRLNTDLLQNSEYSHPNVMTPSRWISPLLWPAAQPSSVRSSS